MPANYSPAPDVERVAQDLIPRHHKGLLEMGARVEYLFRDDVPGKNGRAVLGAAHKLSGLPAYLARRHGGTSGAEANKPLFLVVIAEPAWRLLTPAQRVALVDHELCHLRADLDLKENVVLSLRPHDLEEFAEIAERHGPWMEDVAEFAAALRAGPQLALFGAGSEASYAGR